MKLGMFSSSSRNYTNGELDMMGDDDRKWWRGGLSKKAVKETEGGEISPFQGATTDLQQ